MDIQEYIRKFPTDIRIKLDAVSRQAHEELFTEQELKRIYNVPAKKRAKVRKLVKDHYESVSVLLFIYSLVGIIKAYDVAIRKTLTEVTKLKMPGFMIGKIVYEKGNENVEFARNLLGELKRRLKNKPLYEKLERLKSTSKVIRLYKKDIYRGIKA